MVSPLAVNDVTKVHNTLVYQITTPVYVNQNVTTRVYYNNTPVFSGLRGVGGGGAALPLPLPRPLPL